MSKLKCIFGSSKNKEITARNLRRLMKKNRDVYNDSVTKHMDRETEKETNP